MYVVTGLAMAQAPPRNPVLPGGIVTAGTTTQDSQGRWWAYVRWMPSKLEVLRGKQFAVYVKPGPAAAPGTFTRQAIVTPQDTAAVIAPMLERAQRLGEDLNALSGVVNDLLVHLGEAAPGGALSVRLAGLSHRALGDAKLQATLWRMAAASPAMTFVLGNGWAGMLPGNPGDDVTLEIREWNAATQSAAAATGRLLLQNAQPLRLPAPGVPVQVMDSSASGDLVIRLRWPVEDVLRRQLPHLQGFNLWRVPQAVAQANGWDAAPPTADALDASPEALRLNGSMPLLIGKLFRAADVANFSPAPAGDPDTHFIADDNERWSGGTAFNDGDSFLFFTAARDLLGRAGEVSPAGPGMACRRLAPSAPLGLTLENGTYSAADTPHQCLRLKWKPNTNTPGDSTHRYEIFRCDAAQTINSAVLRDPDAMAALTPVASVPQPAAPGAWITWEDLLAPESDYYGKTLWYGVRAVYDGACGAVVSIPAGPVFGTIANQQAPEPFTSSCAITNCTYAAALHTDRRDEPGAPQLNDNERHLRIVAERLNDGIAAVAFTVQIYQQASLAIDEIVRFDAGDNTVDTELVAPAGPLVVVSVRAILTSGATGPPAITEAYMNQAVDLTRTFHAQVAARAVSDLMPDNALDLPFLTTGAMTVTPAAVDGAAFFQGTIGGQYSGRVVVYRLGHGVPNINLGPACAENGVLFFGDPAGLGSYRAYGLAAEPVPPPGEGSGGGFRHAAEAANGSLTPLRLRFALTPRTAEYRIFRRIDDGDLHLIAQGKRDYSAAMPFFEIPDGNLPANCCHIDYFAQLLDVNGIPGRLIPIGSRVALDRPPPRPTLGDPEATGDAATPTLRIPWSCPPSGVERFEVTIAEKNTGKSSIGATLADKLVFLNSPFLTAKPLPKPERQRFAVMANRHFDRPVAERILTGRVGGQDFQPGPGFEITVGVRPNTEFTISLRAISVTGLTGPVSVERVVTWKMPPPDERVAWPARPVPEPVAFHSGIKAEEFTTLAGTGAAGMRTAGILVGISPPQTGFQPESVDTGRGLRLVLTRQTNTTPVPDFQTWLFAFEKGPPQRRSERLENLMLYRRQEPNATFPEASGDLLQVSSLTGKIGAISYRFNPDLDATALMDPFFSATVEQVAPNAQYPNGYWLAKLYLLDPQPQISGALYHYFLVRFTAAGEVDQVIDAGTLTPSEQ